MSERDDQAWFEVLSGRREPGRDDPGEREADSLRRALTARHAAPELDTERGLDQLLFRLRREGLLEAGKTPRRNVRRWIPAVAAVLIAAVLVVPLFEAVQEWFEPTPWYQDIRFRGEVQPVFVETTTPRAQRDALALELERIDIGHEVFELDSAYCIEVRPPAPLPTRTAESLAALAAEFGFELAEGTPTLVAFVDPAAQHD